MKNIYRGIWADTLEKGQELPVGGSLGGLELTTKIILDFEKFDNELVEFNSSRISEAYELNKNIIKDWLSKINPKMDPYIFYVARTVQSKVKELLAVIPANVLTESELEEHEKKREMLVETNRAKLSDFKGIASCGHQSSLGQYILQNALQKGYSSSYMSGVTTDSSLKKLTNHSIIVIKDKELETYVFDITNPHYDQHNLPRILKTDVPFNYEFLKDKRDLVVTSRNVLVNQIEYFGVGHPWDMDYLKII